VLPPEVGIEFQEKRPGIGQVKTAMRTTPPHARKIFYMGFGDSRIRETDLHLPLAPVYK